MLYAGVQACVMKSDERQAERQNERIKALVKDRGWSGHELARRSGLSPSTANAAIRGDVSTMQAKSLKLLAVAFGWPDWESLMATDALTPPPSVSAAASEDVQARVQEVELRLHDLQRSLVGLRALLTQVNCESNTLAALAFAPTFDAAYSTA